MLEEALKLIRDYNEVKVYGEAFLVLRDDLSGYFWFDEVNVRINFDSLKNATSAWMKLFTGKA